jgi:hypothetical protein
MPYANRLEGLAKKREASHRYRAENLDKCRAYARKRYLKNPEYYKRKATEQYERQFFSRYGITMEQRDQEFEKQGRKCAVCGSLTPRVKSGKWHTDHDHKTAKFRGVLCQPCNTALGSVKDDVAVLQSMIAYLNHHAVEQGPAK